MASLVALFVVLASPLLKEDERPSCVLSIKGGTRIRASINHLIDNYKIACMDYLIGDLGGAIHPEDAPASVWESEFQEAAKKMMELGRKLYNPYYDLEEGDE